MKFPRPFPNAKVMLRISGYNVTTNAAGKQGFLSAHPADITPDGFVVVVNTPREQEISNVKLAYTVLYSQ